MKLFVTSLAIGFAVILLASAEVKCPEISDDSVYFPHEIECGKFYECSSRSAILFTCPTGTYFDPELNICNWNVDCGNLLTSTAPPATTPAKEGHKE
ncbi:endochitinase-like [Anoplophora glabripennis]|uniref:endochitinase-like n=1 Tax=Anoplophora glabripennis TaxID=217634 RepID=UPI0008756D9A|nr:endochitinase-like [Anoplophora glabripennis]